MKVKEFFTHFAEKAGFDTADKSFADFIAANEKLEIPDSFASEVQNKLMNEDDAKKSASIASHFKGQVFSTVDSEIEKILADYDDDTKNVVKGEKSSFKKIGLLINKTKELEAQKAGASKGDKAELAKKIDDLNKEIVKLTEDHKNTIAAKEAEYEEKIYDSNFRSELATRSYANDKVAKHVNILTAKNVIADALSNKGAKAVYKDGKFVLVDAKSPDLAFRENHKDVPFDSFVDKVLQENGLLKVSEPQKPGNNYTPPATPGTNDMPGFEEIKSFYKTQEAEYAKNGSH